MEDSVSRYLWSVTLYRTGMAAETTRFPAVLHDVGSIDVATGRGDFSRSSFYQEPPQSLTLLVGSRLAPSPAGVSSFPSPPSQERIKRPLLLEKVMSSSNHKCLYSRGYTLEFTRNLALILG